MCKFKSAIILKDRVFVPDYDSHTDMLEELGIKDTEDNASKLFVRAELIPPKNDVFTDIETWNIHIDQDIMPEWFVLEYEKQRLIDAVKVWAKSHIYIDVNDFKIVEGENYYLKNCKNVICNNSRVKAYNNSTVEAYNNSTVEAWGNSTVKAWDNSTVKAWGNSRVEAWGNSTVEALGNSTVEAWGNSTVKAWDNSTVEALGNSTVKAWGNSRVEAWDNSTVKAWGNSRVEAWGNSTVEALGNSTVEAWGNSTVKAWDNSTVVKNEYSYFNAEKLILCENATFKDCSTKTVYQSGDYKLVSVKNGKINNKAEI